MHILQYLRKTFANIPSKKIIFLGKRLQGLQCPKITQPAEVWENDMQLTLIGKPFQVGEWLKMHI